MPLELPQQVAAAEETALNRRRHYISSRGRPPALLLRCGRERRADCCQTAGLFVPKPGAASQEPKPRDRVRKRRRGRSPGGSLEFRIWDHTGYYGNLTDSSMPLEKKYSNPIGTAKLPVWKIRRPVPSLQNPASCLEGASWDSWLGDFSMGTGGTGTQKVYHCTKRQFLKPPRSPGILT
ncbi:hypothetical protein AAFF_G00105220 [Aldrovandia affinis]|uniref:Uncharacterized protein n=1 Tax=Aldrovandia affinis TaxID=143900 RepID=A0AAD7T240_9TELE|nr:hypothetical protein AAFF_G00105220 [Aldrovandia affinis]